MVTWEKNKGGTVGRRRVSNRETRMEGSNGRYTGIKRKIMKI